MVFLCLFKKVLVRWGFPLGLGLHFLLGAYLAGREIFTGYGLYLLDRVVACALVGPSLGT